MGPDAVLTWREASVTAVLECLETRRFLFAKAPPFSGKTSLAQLVQRKLLSPHTHNLLFVNFSTVQWASSFEDWWESQTHVKWNELFNIKTKTVIICDEVQCSYFLGKDNPFWVLVKNIKRGEYLFRNFDLVG